MDQSISVTNITGDTKRQLLQKLNDERAALMAPVIAYMCVLMTVGLVGNSLVCFYYGRKTKTTSNSILICTLGYIDLFTSGCSIPLEILDLRLFFDFNNVVACKFMRFLNYSSAIGSAFTLIFISIDRYNHICRLFKRQLTLQHVKVGIWCVALLTVLFSWPSIVVFKPVQVNVKNDYGVNITGSDCTTERSASFKIYIWIFNGVYLLFYLVSSGLLFTMYVLIAIRIYKQAHFRKRFLKPISVVSNLNRYAEEERSSPGLSVRKMGSDRERNKSKFLRWRSQKYVTEAARHNTVEDEDADDKSNTASSSADNETNASFFQQGARQLSLLSFTIVQTVSLGESSVRKRVAKRIKPTNTETFDMDGRTTGVSLITCDTHVQIETNRTDQPDTIDEIADDIIGVRQITLNRKNSSTEAAITSGNTCPESMKKGTSDNEVDNATISKTTQSALLSRPTSSTHSPPPTTPTTAPNNTTSSPTTTRTPTTNTTPPSPAKMANTTTTTTPNHPTATISSLAVNKKQSTGEMLNIKYTVMMFSITGVFILSFVPYLALSTWRSLMTYYEGGDISDASLIAFNIGIRSTFLNAAINPFIYGFFNTHFRTFFLSLVCPCYKPKHRGVA